jgi:DNA repair protein RecN (Recombination protein N)
MKKYDEVFARLDELEGADERRAALEKEERAAVARARDAADRLHAAREKAAILLQKEITEALSFLDMPAVRFAVKVAVARDGELPAFDRNGYDRVEFMIATNPGEALAPMVKIASGGELSRIMLALKSVITDKDGIPTVIYDEIDTGVSGKTARKIGVKLRDASARTQILCVTHSAQIASLADTHFLIEKGERDGRAETTVRVLTGDARVEELARILGGLSVTEAQRRAAMDMLSGV